jgi:hypothetical protein
MKSGYRRRWLQFSLRSVLVLIVLVAVALVLVRVYVAPFYRQRAVIAMVERLGGSYATEAGGPSWVRSIFTEDFCQNVVHIDLADCDDPDAYLAGIKQLPCLESLVVGGLGFTDAHLPRVTCPSLRGIVLDSTCVTDPAMAELAAGYPELIVHRSERRAIAAFSRAGRGVGGHTQEVDGPAWLKRRIDKDHFHALVAAVVADANTGAVRYARATHSLKALCVSGRLAQGDLDALSVARSLRILHLIRSGVTSAEARKLADDIRQCVILVREQNKPVLRYNPEASKSVDWEDPWAA